MKNVLINRYNYYKNLSIHEKREWNTLFIIYPFALIMLILYFLKYNFYYKVSDYNNYFYTLLMLMVVIITMGLISKKKDLAFVTYLFALTIAVVFMIFVSGGVKAPGMAWLTLLGPVYGLFYGKKGIFLGLICSVIFFIILFYLDKYGLNPNVILMHANYQTEKNSNFFTFLLFMGSNFLAYAIAYERAEKELKIKNDEIEVFLRILFHDVANPLAIITLSSDMMMKRNNFNEVGVQRIKTAATNLKEQLESVKKLKALKDGKFELDIKNFNIKNMVDKSADIFTEKASEKNVKIITTCSEPEATIKVDQVIFINQIMSNIISNSIKFSYPNSEIHISIKSQLTKYRIDIQDFGIGMPEEIKKNLFDVEKVISRHGTNKEAGTGYGLSLAKHFIENFGGTIDVSSIEQTPDTINHGTTFTISLPKN
jgi:signal transduction histidine kinase